MTREMIAKAFAECKEKANLDFALTKATADCSTCTWADIEAKYGMDARGIWLKYFTWGANKRKFDTNINYIAHYLTNEQKDIVCEVLQKYFAVEWADKDDHVCIKIENKRPKTILSQQ